MSDELGPAGEAPDRGGGPRSPDRNDRARSADGSSTGGARQSADENAGDSPTEGESGSHRTGGDGPDAATATTGEGDQETPEVEKASDEEKAPDGQKAPDGEKPPDGEKAPDGEGLITRRRALMGTGLVGLGAVGYSVLSILNPPDSPVPRLPTDEMEADGWVWTEGEGAPVTDVQVGPLTITTRANTVQYGNRRLLDDIRAREVTVEVTDQTFSRTLAESAGETLDQYLSIFVASRIDLGPDVDDLPLGIGRAEIMEQARGAGQTSFERTMFDAGLQNVERTDSGTLDVDTGETASLDRYRAEFPFEGGTTTVLDQEVSIPSTELEIAGYLAVWHHEDWIMVAAGAHPNENYADSVQRDLEAGQTATVSLDFGLTPSEYREEMLGYIERMR